MTRRSRSVRHHLARRSPGGGRLRDRRRQAAHRRAARPPRRRTSSRAAGRAPTRRTSSSSPAPRPSCSSTPRRSSRSARPAATRQGRRRPDPAQPDRGGHARGVHRRQELGVPRTEALQTTLDEGEAMIADSVRFLARRGPPGARRHGALLRRLQGATRSSRCGPSRRPWSTAPTHARAVRHQRRLAARRGRARSSPTSRATSATTSIIGIHCHDDTGCAVANSMAAVRGRRRPRAGHAQRPRRAHRQRNLTTVIPNLQLKLGYACLPEGRIERLTRGEPPRRRAGEPGAQPAGAVRRLVGVRPQGRPARVGDRAGQGRLRARRPGAGRQRHPLRRVARWPGGRRSRSRPTSSASSSTARRSTR